MGCQQTFVRPRGDDSRSFNSLNNDEETQGTFSSRRQTKTINLIVDSTHENDNNSNNKKAKSAQDSKVKEQREEENYPLSLSTQGISQSTNTHSNGSHEIMSKTFSNEAAQEYQARIEAKRAAEQIERHRIIMEQFDPIKPLDNFNVNHRGLLGRCWDRRAAELGPITFVHAMNDYVINTRLMNSEKNIEELNKPKLPIARSSHWFAAAGLIFSDSTNVTCSNSNTISTGTTNTTTTNTNSSSNTITTTTTTTNGITNSSSGSGSSLRKSIPHSLFVSTGSYESNSNEHDIFSHPMYHYNSNNNNNPSGNSNNIMHSPLSIMNDVSNRTGSPITQVPVFSVEELQAMSFAERLELFNKCVNVQLKSNGIKPNWAFVVSHEVSESEDAHLLRKRNLQPAFGVEVHYWNRAEFVIPTFHSLQRAVMMTEGETNLGGSPSKYDNVNHECHNTYNTTSVHPTGTTSLTDLGNTSCLSHSPYDNQKGNERKQEQEYVKEETVHYANDPLHDTVKEYSEEQQKQEMEYNVPEICTSPLVIEGSMNSSTVNNNNNSDKITKNFNIYHMQNERDTIERKAAHEYELSSTFNLSPSSPPVQRNTQKEEINPLVSTSEVQPRHSFSSFAHHLHHRNKSNGDESYDSENFYHHYMHQPHSYTTCLLAHNETRKPFPQECIMCLNLAIPTSRLATLYQTPLTTHEVKIHSPNKISILWNQTSTCSDSKDNHVNKQTISLSSQEESAPVASVQSKSESMYVVNNSNSNKTKCNSLPTYTSNTKVSNTTSTSQPLSSSLPPKLSPTSMNSPNNHSTTNVDSRSSSDNNNNSSFTYLSALTICCFSTSIDPLHWSEHKYTRFPVDLELGKTSCMTSYGEGVITSIMYGGTLIVECSSYEAAKQLEDVLAGCSWAAPRNLTTLVSDVRHRLRSKVDQVKHLNSNSSNSNKMELNNKKNMKESLNSVNYKPNNKLSIKDASVSSVISKTIQKSQQKIKANKNNNNPLDNEQDDHDSKKQKNEMDSNNDDDSSNKILSYRYRISQRIGGHPMRDQVEFQEISLLVSESGIQEQSASLVLSFSSNNNNQNKSQKETISHKENQSASSASVKNVNLASPSSVFESQDSKSNSHTEHYHSGEKTKNKNLEDIKVNEANTSYSRVASVWVGLHTIAVVLRSWGLHLLAHPEYAMPISLYLQKYAGIAPALRTNTLNLFSFHDNNNFTGHRSAFPNAPHLSNTINTTHTNNLNTGKDNSSFFSDPHHNHNSNMSSQSTEHSDSMDRTKGSVSLHYANMEDELFANDLLFNDPHDLTNSFASAEEYPHGPVKRIATSMLSLHKPERRIPSYNKFYVPNPTPPTSLLSEASISADDLTLHGQIELEERLAKERSNNNNEKSEEHEKTAINIRGQNARNKSIKSNYDNKKISRSCSAQTLPHCNQSKQTLDSILEGEDEYEEEGTQVSVNKEEEEMQNKQIKTNINVEKDNVDTHQDHVSGNNTSIMEVESLYNQHKKFEGEESKKKKDDLLEILPPTHTSSHAHSLNELSLNTSTNTSVHEIPGLFSLCNSSDESLSYESSSSSSSSSLSSSSSSSSADIANAASLRANTTHVKVTPKPSHNGLSRQRILHDTFAFHPSSALLLRRLSSSQISTRSTAMPAETRKTSSPSSFEKKKRKQQENVIESKPEQALGSRKIKTADRLFDSEQENKVGESYCDGRKMKGNEVQHKFTSVSATPKRELTLSSAGQTEIFDADVLSVKCKTNDTSPLPTVRGKHKHHKISNNRRVQQEKEICKEDNEAKVKTNNNQNNSKKKNKQHTYKNTAPQTAAGSLASSIHDIDNLDKERSNGNNKKNLVSELNTKSKKAQLPAVNNRTTWRSFSATLSSLSEISDAHTVRTTEQEQEEYRIKEHEAKWNMTMLELKALQQEWKEVCDARDEAEKEHNTLHNTLYSLQRIFLPYTPIAELDGVFLYIHTAITQPRELFNGVLYLSSGDWLGILLAVWINQSNYTNNIYEIHNNSCSNGKNNVSALCSIDIAAELTWRDLPKIGILAGLFYFHEGQTSSLIQTLRINAAKLLGSSVDNNSLQVNSNTNNKESEQNSSLHNMSFFQKLRAKRKARLENSSKTDTEKKRKKRRITILHGKRKWKEKTIYEYYHISGDDNADDGQGFYTSSDEVEPFDTNEDNRSEIELIDFNNNNNNNNNNNTKEKNANMGLDYTKELNNNNKNNFNDYTNHIYSANNDIIANGPNHGLGDCTPPFYVTVEQARDILWVLLCAIAENALCTHHHEHQQHCYECCNSFFHSHNGYCSANRSFQNTQYERANTFRLIFDGFPLDADTMAHNTNHSNKNHKNNKYSSNNKEKRNSSLIQRLFHSKKESTASGKAEADIGIAGRQNENGGTNEVYNLDSFIIIPQSSYALSESFDSPFSQAHSSIHRIPLLSSSTTLSFSPYDLECNSADNTCNVKQVCNNDKNSSVNTTNDAAITKIKKDELRKESSQMIRSHTHSSISEMHHNESIQRTCSADFTLNMSFHVHHPSSQFHVHRSNSYNVSSDAISNNHPTNNNNNEEGILHSVTSDAVHNVEDHAFYSILYHSNKSDESSSPHNNHNNVESNNFYNLNSAVFERVEYLNPYNFNHNHAEYALPPLRECKLRNMYEKRKRKLHEKEEHTESGKWIKIESNEEEHSHDETRKETEAVKSTCTNDNVNMTSQQEQQSTAEQGEAEELELLLPHGNKIFGLHSEHEEREVLISEIAYLHSHAGEIWEALCKSVEQFNKTHLLVEQEEQNWEKESREKNERRTQEDAKETSSNSRKRQTHLLHNSKLMSCAKSTAHKKQENCNHFIRNKDSKNCNNESINYQNSNYLGNDESAMCNRHVYRHFIL